MGKIDEISVVMQEYYLKKNQINTSNSEDIVLINYKQNELRELKEETSKKLSAIREKLMDIWHNYVVSLTSVITRLNKTNDINLIEILSKTCDEVANNTKEIDAKVRLIDNYLATEFSSENTVYVDIKNPEVELTDERENLSNNARILEQEADKVTDGLEDVLPFVDTTLKPQEPVDRDTLLMKSFSDMINGVGSLSVHDSTTRYIENGDGTEISKVSVRNIKLPNGKYINSRDFENALFAYAEANKDKKLLVLDTMEYSLDYENLEKCWTILKECNVILVDKDRNAYVVTNNSSEPIGEAPENTKPGNYIPVKEALYGLDKIIKEEKSGNDENTGGTPYVKTKQS